MKKESETIETARLRLRPWRESDAEALFRHASNPNVGNAAGWPPHESVEMSREVITNYFSAPDIYALELKATGEVVGCCGLVPAVDVHVVEIGTREAEIGYWIGVEFWGQGLVPEAVAALAKHYFGADLLDALWTNCFALNRQSQRVAEKCGFTFHHSQDGAEVGRDGQLFYVLRK